MDSEEEDMEKNESEIAGQDEGLIEASESKSEKKDQIHIVMLTIYVNLSIWMHSFMDLIEESFKILQIETSNLKSRNSAKRKLCRRLQCTFW